MSRRHGSYSIINNSPECWGSQAYKQRFVGYIPLAADGAPGSYTPISSPSAAPQPQHYVITTLGLDWLAGSGRQKRLAEVWLCLYGRQYEAVETWQGHDDMSKRIAGCLDVRVEDCKPKGRYKNTQTALVTFLCHQTLPFLKQEKYLKDYVFELFLSGTSTEMLSLSSGFVPKYN
eukprot:m.119956 g.119956  ORF g.119956 m.119956 type:complete len:175 (-) comp15602_c0_seq10:12-536(-)